MDVKYPYGVGDDVKSAILDMVHSPEGSVSISDIVLKNVQTDEDVLVENISDKLYQEYIDGKIQNPDDLYKYYSDERNEYVTEEEYVEEFQEQHFD